MVVSFAGVLHSIDTGSQVCNLAWSRNVNELVSTHGYSQNQIVVWAYPAVAPLATLTGHTMRVLYLAVSPDHQRKSYGTVMMRAIEKLLLERGCPKLNLQIRHTNEVVIDFYNSIGYGEDAVVSMGKRLIPDH